MQITVTFQRKGETFPHTFTIGNPDMLKGKGKALAKAAARACNLTPTHCGPTHERPPWEGRDGFRCFVGCEEAEALVDVVD